MGRADEAGVGEGGDGLEMMSLFPSPWRSAVDDAMGVEGAEGRQRKEEEEEEERG